MRFQEIKSDKYVKYIVKQEYRITKNSVRHKPDKIFEKSEDAIAYIKELKRDAKEYPELYSNQKIILQRIKTITDDFLIVDGE